MTAQKPPVKMEKAKQLREMRRRLDWTQQQMAEALGLDPSYLSQLENGRRKLDDWYLKKAGEFEKSKTANIFGSVTPESYSLQSTAESCVTYLKQFLGTCQDPAKIVWTYVELQEHFPLDKWTDPKAAEVSSKLPFSAAMMAPKPAADFDREHRTP
jgi:DNA-binding XRE family transcriptional regulator